MPHPAPPAGPTTHKWQAQQEQRAPEAQCVLKASHVLQTEMLGQPSSVPSLIALCEEQAHALRSLEARLTSVEERLELLLVDVKGSSKCASWSVQQARHGTVNEPEEAETGDQEEFGSGYNLSVSMWDAAMLLGFRRVKMTDKLAILTGIVINWALQLLLLLVVQFDMIKNTFEDQRVEALMTWRVEKGHELPGLDGRTGLTRVERLCNQSLWSFEQNEYVLMHDYIYQRIPGWSLTILAITVWVLHMAKEFQSVFQQGMAILQLPRVAANEYGIIQTEDRVQIVGMRRTRKFSVVLFLVLPRMGVTVALAFIGCHYLALTVSLPDIVINSVALAFVIQVDELIAEVLLPRRLKTMIKNVGCIEGSTRCKIVRRLMPNLIRYVLAPGLIIFSWYQWLGPFHGNVEAAAMALCAGNTGFLQTGADANLSTVVVLDTKNFTSICPSTASPFEDNYFLKYYGINTSGQKEGLSRTTEELKQARLRTTLLYAFNNRCPSGQIQDPYGKCTLASERFHRPFRKLTRPVEAGGNIAVPQCKAFDPKLGAAACSATNPMPSCRWTWQRYQCEQGSPPGLLHQLACPQTFTKFTALEKSCEVWEDWFQEQHPLVDCNIRKICRKVRTTDCRRLVGQLNLAVRNVSRYQASQGTTEAAISSGLSAALGVDASTVVILQVRGWPVSISAEKDWNLKLPSSRSSQRRILTHLEWMNTWWEETGPKVDSNSISLVRFGVRQLPVTLVERSIPGRIAATMAEWMDNTTELDDGTVTSVNFTQLWLDSLDS